MNTSADISLPSMSNPRWCHCRWAAAYALAVLFIIAQPRTLHAQNASCGEPERKQEVDTDEDGKSDRTVTLEQCLVREFEINGEAKKIIAYWTTTSGIATDRLGAVDSDGTPGDDLQPAALALFAVLWAQDTWETYRSWGFGDPNGRSDLKIHLFDVVDGTLGTCCSADGAISMDAPLLMDAFRFGGDHRGAEATVTHELWHGVQPGGTFPAWVTEGNATWSEDVVNTELDEWATSDYVNLVNWYMALDHTVNLDTLEYRAAPWWTYFAEKVGDTLAEPGRGVDAVLAFYQASGGPMARLDSVINARRSDSFTAMWMRFAQANFTKNLDPANQHAQLRYDDQLQPGGANYRAVDVQGQHDLATEAVLPTLSSVQAWSSSYYVFEVDATVPLIDVHVRTELNREVGFALMAFNGNTLVRGSESIGKQFDRMWVNNNFDRVVLIVVGLRESAGFRYTANAATPALQIVDPITAAPQNVDRFNAPGKLLVKVKIFADEDGNPIAGVDPNAIAISVGGVAVPAEARISSAYIQDHYWLLVRAPAQLADGDYDLVVTHGALSDTEANAVRYAPRRDIDSLIVLDVSGSMQDSGKIDAAKSAARLYVDSYRAGDNIGLVTFEFDAKVDVTLRGWETGRLDTINAIDAVVANGGATSPGDGAKAGLDELIAHGSNLHDWSLVALSDGLENTEITIEDYLATDSARRNAAPPQQVPSVHAIALGPDADRVKMERLADRTGGRYFVVSVPVAATASVNAVSLPLDLAEIYRVASESITHQQQVFVTNSDLCLDNVNFQEHLIPVDGGASELVVVAAWTFGDVADPRLVLKQPDGLVSYPAAVTYPRHWVWRVPTPQAGNWILAAGVDALASRAASPDLLICDQPTPYLVEAAVVSELTLDVYLGLPVEKRLVGNPMLIFATLADTAPVGGATVEATITRPDGSVFTIPLLDDGLHDDGAALDGFYGGLFPYTWVFGGYDLVVRATGESPTTGAFVRRARAGFNMVEFRILPGLGDLFDPNRQLDYNDPNDPNKPYVDVDSDFVPDWWEIEWGLDPELSDSGTLSQDPDHDGLDNQNEFAWGTDPTRSDTDGGGEGDWSETNYESNPHDPADDAVPCPFSFSAGNVRWHADDPELVPGVLLRYDVAPDHSYVYIHRAPSEEGPWETIATDEPATGEYHDTSVGDGETAYYRLWAYDVDGHESCALGPVSAVAGADTLPPSGFVTINNWQTRTVSVDVSLHLEATYGTTEMLVSNSPDFDGAEWEEYQKEKEWVLEPVGGVGEVYVLYRDEAGNVSSGAMDSILVDVPGGPDPDPDPDPDPGPGGSVELYLPSLYQGEQE